MNCFTKPLKLALAETGAAIKSRPPLPILSCVRLKTKDGMLELVTTDINSWVLRLVPCKGELSVCVNHSKLKQVIEQASEEASIEMDGNRLLVKSGRTKTQLPTLPIEEFPNEQFGEMKQVAVIASEIGNGIDSVAWSADSEGVKPPVYGNILIKLESKKATCFASRSVVSAIWQSNLICEEREIVVPAMLSEMLVPVLKDEHSDLFLSENYIMAKSLNGSTVVKLFNGEYLKWDSIQQLLALRDSGNAGVQIDTELLKKACAFAQIVNPPNETPALEIEQTEETLTLRAGSDDYVDTVESKYEPQLSRFNSLYLSSALPKLNSEKVRMVSTKSGVFFDAGNLTVAVGLLPNKV